MAVRKKSKSETFNLLQGSFNTQYEAPEEAKKRGLGKPRKEWTPLKSETTNQFKQEKLDRRLDKGQYGKMDGRDMLLFFKTYVEKEGNKCPITLHGNQHNLMKTLIQKYGAYTVYTVIKFLFEAEQTFIHKRVISLHYVNRNIEWLQAYGDMFEKNEDYSELMKMCKPVSGKQYDKNVGNIRESKYDKDDESGEW